MEETPKSQNSPSNEEEEIFFDEMDRKSPGKSCCTCQTMIIVFVILLAVLVVLTLIINSRIKAPSNMQVTTPTSENELLVANEKLQNAYLRKPDSKGMVTIELTSEELKALVSAADQDLLLKSIQVNITPLGIEAQGLITSPLKTNLTLMLACEVENSQVKIKVTDIKAGSLNIPSFLAQKISAQAEELFSKQFKKIQHFEIQEIDLESGKMLIKGTPTVP